MGSERSGGLPDRSEKTLGRGILEHAPRSQDPAVLQAQARIALSRQIVQDIAGTGGELPVVTLEPELEQLLQNSTAAGGVAGVSGQDPWLISHPNQPGGGAGGTSAYYPSAPSGSMPGRPPGAPRGGGQ